MNGKKARQIRQMTAAYRTLEGCPLIDPVDPKTGGVANWNRRIGRRVEAHHQYGPDTLQRRISYLKAELQTPLRTGERMDIHEAIDRAKADLAAIRGPRIKLVTHTDGKVYRGFPGWYQLAASEIGNEVIARAEKKLAEKNEGDAEEADLRTRLRQSSLKNKMGMKLFGNGNGRKD